MKSDNFRRALHRLSRIFFDYRSLVFMQLACCAEISAQKMFSISWYHFWVNEESVFSECGWNSI